MHDDLCQKIRDYIQTFGKGCRIIRRAEFLEEIRYIPNISQTVGRVGIFHIDVHVLIIILVNQQHAGELSASQDQVQSNTHEVQNLYMMLTDEDNSSQDTALDDLTHSQMVAESINVIESLKQQVCISMGRY